MSQAVLFQRPAVPGNLSTAVRNRRVEPSDSLDLFATPPWAVRALLERLDLPSSAKVCEPCCGTMKIAETLAECPGIRVASTDIHPHWLEVQRRYRHALGGDGVPDTPSVVDAFELRHKSADWIITNPPFNQADRLASRFLDPAYWPKRMNIALLLRSNWIEGSSRYFSLFAKRPPSLVLHFAERVPIHAGGLCNWYSWDKRAQRWGRSSTATAYAWFVWLRDQDSAPGGWRGEVIAPCRDRLERLTDYDDLVTGGFVIPDKFAIEAEALGIQGRTSQPAYLGTPT